MLLDREQVKGDEEENYKVVAVLKSNSVWINSFFVRRSSYSRVIPITACEYVERKRGEEKSWDWLGEKKRRTREIRKERKVKSSANLFTSEVVSCRSENKWYLFLWYLVCRYWSLEWVEGPRPVVHISCMVMIPQEQPGLSPRASESWDPGLAKRTPWRGVLLSYCRTCRRSSSQGLWRIPLVWWWNRRSNKDCVLELPNPVIRACQGELPGKGIYCHTVELV